MKASFFGLAALAALVSAAPLEKRQSTGNITDGTILNYALTLEHLEATFYRTGLQNFSADAFSQAGYPDWVRKRVVEIGGHEVQHVDFLTTALKAAGANPVAECTYAFGVTDPKSFLATAQILEGVGVAAYLGAAASIANKAYLTAAGSILTVEARHSSWIRSAANKGDGFPNAFEIGLGFNEVYSLAAGFITGCPSSNGALPFKAFPTLAASPASTSAGSTITLKASNLTSSNGTLYAAFIGALANNTYVDYDPSSGSVQVPQGFAGQTYVVITNQKNVTDDTVLAGPAVFDIPVNA